MPSILQDQVPTRAVQWTLVSETVRGRVGEPPFSSADSCNMGMLEQSSQVLS